MKTKLALISVLIIVSVTIYIKHLKSQLDDALTELATVKASNAMLKITDDVGRVITKHQLTVEQSLREQADGKVQELQNELSTNNCSSVRLPTVVLDRLRE